MNKTRLASLATAAVMMTASFAGAVSLPETSPFNDLQDVEFYFSSGVGGWYTRMVIAPDGTFTGDFHDSEMGESGEGYPNGSVYGCLFHGTLSAANQMDDYTWLLNMDELMMDEGQLPEYIEDGIRYITTDSVYGLENTTELLLYLPGHDLASLPEGYMTWSHLNLWETMPETLPFYGLYNMVEECGFVGETVLINETHQFSNFNSDAMDDKEYTTSKVFSLADFDRIIIGKTTMSEAEEYVIPKTIMLASYGFLCEYDTIENMTVQIKFSHDSMTAFSKDVKK